MSTRGRWLKGAIKRPGALRQKLLDLGLVKMGHKISMRVLRQAAKGTYGPQTARRARLAITMRGFRKKGRKR